MIDGRRIMTAVEIRRAVVRISHEIVEKQAGTHSLALVAVRRLWTNADYVFHDDHFADKNTATEG